MKSPLLGSSHNGNPMHYSVGAVIERDGAFLLIDRVMVPYGWAAPAGHVSSGETYEQALCQKVREEVGLDIVSSQLLFTEEIHPNLCHAGIDYHLWNLYSCQTQGEVTLNPLGAKSFLWVRRENIAALTLEPVWQHWFRKLSVIA